MSDRIVIEIHNKFFRDALGVKNRIYKYLFEGKPRMNDVVVDIITSQAIDKDDNPKPYLRVYTKFADDEYAKVILDALKILNLDIDHIKLDGHILKKK